MPIFSYKHYPDGHLILSNVVGQTESKSKYYGYMKVNENFK